MPNKHSYQHVKTFIESQGYQLLSENYKNAHEKLLLKCPIGHSYETNFSCFSQNRRCPICAINNRKLPYNYVKSFIESKGYQLLSENYKNAHEKLLLKCPIGHSYEVTYGNFYRGQRCAKCNGGIKLTLDYVREFIEKENYQLLSNSYKNARSKLLLKCPIGHEYKTKFYSFQQGNRCPICWHESSSSKEEQNIQLFVKSLGYNIICNDRSLLVNPLTGKNLELDIFIPSLNKAIEYNGEYWHSLLNKQKLDKIKKDQCKQLGINLLIINEKTFLSDKQQEFKKITMWLKE